MANHKIVGVSCWKKRPDFAAMKEAGIEWVRLYVPFPFKDEAMSQLSERYVRERKNILNFSENGFNILCITPLFGQLQSYQDPDFLEQFFRAYEYDRPIGKPEEIHFYTNIPAWAGDYKSENFYKTMIDACAFIGRDLMGKVRMYQISGEMDCKRFTGPMTIDQVVRFINSSALGIKQGDPDAMVGINTTALVEWGPTGERNENAYSFYRTMYTRANLVDFDYAGMDGFMGTFHRGKPTDWYRWIDEVYEITKKPILINEWGYSSLGAFDPASWPKEAFPPGYNPICETQSWPNSFAGVHSQESQASYLSICLKIFADHPRVIGSIMYDWQDDLFCYCKKAFCPHECGWGLVDRLGRSKKAYFAFKEAVREFYG